MTADAETPAPTRLHALAVAVSLAVAAVGWDAWRPGALSPTRQRLARAIVLSEGARELVDADDYVREAIEGDDRNAAVVAHKIIAGFELNVRETRELLADR